VADVTLRFYGRFVLAQKQIGGKARGAVTFLAPRFKAPFRAHKIMMSAPRSVVSTRKTKRAPTLRLMAAGNPQVTEHFAWDLSGCDVTPSTRGPVNIVPATASVTIANLKELERLQGRPAVLDRKNLRGSARGSVSAAIKVSGGDAILRQVFPEFTDFVPLDKKRPAVVRKVQLADVVDVQIKLPKGSQEMKIRLKQGRASSVVTIQTINASGTPSPTGSAIVTFTNLCSQIPRSERFDLEFGQYYELLKGGKVSSAGRTRSSTRPDRLIPNPVPAGGEVGDCNEGALIPY
jgi:hypothetical protein